MGISALVPMLEVTMEVKRNTESASGFCGPAALSAITGNTVEECCAMIRKLCYKRSVKGMTDCHMIRVLTAFGYTATQLFYAGYERRKQRPTMAAWLKAFRGKRDFDDKLLMAAGHHYVVIQGLKLWDNANPKGVYLSRYSHRRKRVHGVWLVRKVQG